jgi:pilus assembly protein CpaD
MKNIATCTLLVLSATLAGCVGNSQNANRSLDSIHQPVVSTSSHYLDIASYGGDISPAEAQRVDEWLEAIGVTYGDQAVIEDDGIYGSPAAVVALRKLLTDRGVKTVAISQGRAMRLQVTRSVAYVPNCPDWTSRYTTDPLNETSSNYGCAVNGNLAAMVADPKDLVRGVSSATSNTQQGVKAIQAYREKPVTGAQELKASETSEVSGGGGQ